MSNPNEPRWFQFSLRDMAWLIALACCVWFAWTEHRLGAQKATDSQAQADKIFKQMEFKFASEKLAAEREIDKWQALYKECRAESKANEKAVTAVE